MITNFLQIHSLTSYPGALLNRDDAGFSKRLPFGGATRTRVSSQCLKRHWRTFTGEHGLSELGVQPSVRSRLTFERHVVRPLVEEGLSEPLVRAVTEAMMAELLGLSAKARARKERDGEGALETGQLTVMGHPELEYIRQQVREVCREAPEPKRAAVAVKAHLGPEGRKNLRALRHGAGLCAALFGRMVTSDVLARVDAAIHVAHAFTVHAELSETDYFSAIDDLRQTEEGELGCGHINSTELTSGLYYGYVVIDVPLLISNLEGCDRARVEGADRTMAAEVVERMVHLVATVTPGAKLGSTAPYASAHLVMVEAGAAQPRTLANAFLNPVGHQGDLIVNTYQVLRAHLEELDQMYGVRTGRRFAALGPAEILRDVLGERRSLAEVAAWARSQVLGDQAPDATLAPDERRVGAVLERQGGSP